MTRPTQIYARRGEPVTLGWEVQSGNPTGLTLVADLKRSVNMTVPVREQTALESLNVVFVAASGPDPARWDATLSAMQTAALKAGTYVTDANVKLSGTTIYISPPVFITLLESVSV